MEASFIREKSACLMEVSVTEHILRKFPEILGELSMHKQWVPGSFFFAHTQEPGNEASLIHMVGRSVLNITYPCAANYPSYF